MPRTNRLMAGVMSGTSADGVDVALCRLPLGEPVGNPGGTAWGELVVHVAHPYPQSLRSQIHGVRQDGTTTLADLAALTRAITLEHAHAVRLAAEAANLPLHAIDAVADHGQTLFHAPPLTIQVLDPSLLAWQLGTLVVSDFRRADLAAGGEGAPLVPYADRVLFSHASQTRALLNLGGIANVTILPPKSSGSTPVLAFDIGPANCLSDHLARTDNPMGTGFDPGGRAALRGTAEEAVVAGFLRSAYFSKPPPKSTDGPEMIAAFESAGGMRLGYDDAQATAAECVARAVSAAIAPFAADEVIVSGGGVLNQALMRHLAVCLGETGLRSTAELGVPSEAKEAIAFALLGHATLLGQAGNVPSATGASAEVVLGCISPKPLP